MYETFTANQKDRIVLNNDNDFKRKSVEHCQNQGKVIVNPIIDWEDSEVWEFIRKYDLPYNPLYDEGYKRVGCVGCPMGRNDIELEKEPKFKQHYIRAGARYLERRKKNGREGDFTWRSPEHYYLWWTEQIKSEIAQIDGQVGMGE